MTGRFRKGDTVVLNGHRLTVDGVSNAGDTVYVKEPDAPASAWFTVRAEWLPDPEPRPLGLHDPELFAVMSLPGSKDKVRVRLVWSADGTHLTNANPLVFTARDIVSDRDAVCQRVVDALTTKGFFGDLSAMAGVAFDAIFGDPA